MSNITAWREVRHEFVADCRVFTVERSISISPFDGAERAFYQIRSPEWSQIVPLTAKNEIVMVRQFRHGSGKVTLEIPGGLVDPGETPVEAAVRECLEETGYRVQEAAPLGVTNPNPALFTNSLHSFVAFGATAERAIENTSSEQTEVVLVPVAPKRACHERVIDRSREQQARQLRTRHQHHLGLLARRVLDRALRGGSERHERMQ